MAAGVTIGLLPMTLQQATSSPSGRLVLFSVNSSAEHSHCEAVMSSMAMALPFFFFFFAEENVTSLEFQSTHKHSLPVIVVAQDAKI